MLSTTDYNRTLCSLSILHAGTRYAAVAAPFLASFFLSKCNDLARSASHKRLVRSVRGKRSVFSSSSRNMRQNADSLQVSRKQ